MKFNTTELIDGLTDEVEAQIVFLKDLKKLSADQLNWRRAENTWSILECIAHLNLYCDFYLPEICQKMAPKNTEPNAEFKSGYLGEYFAKSMLPKPRLNKMKTFKSMNPIHSNLSLSELSKFEACLQQELLQLNEARKLDLNKVKTAVSISKWIKLRLGDTFRVLVYHQKRHFVQIESIIKDQKVAH